MSAKDGLESEAWYRHRGLGAGDAVLASRQRPGPATLLLSFKANLSRERKGTRMTTICLSEEIIALLENLDEPLDFCDESGHLLGSFIPEPAMRELLPIAEVESEGDLRAVEEQLGAEMCVFGFERDLE
jgi:hypothetical protein